MFQCPYLRLSRTIRYTLNSLFLSSWINEIVNQSRNWWDSRSDAIRYRYTSLQRGFQRLGLSLVWQAQEWCTRALLFSSQSQRLWFLLRVRWDQIIRDIDAFLRWSKRVRPIAYGDWALSANIKKQRPKTDSFQFQRYSNRPQCPA